MNGTDVFIIAGEASGDLHASNLINRIKSFKPDLSAKGIGGAKLASESVNLIFDYSEVNFVGLQEIANNYKHIRSNLLETKDHITRINPSVVILTDFPGFNLRLAKEIRSEYKGKIIYYITPQVWAWHPGRVKQLRKYVDLCLVIFPFEEKFLKNEGVNARYVGHPLIAPVDEFLKDREKKINPSPVVTIMPGSRLQEINRILPVLAGTAAEMIDKYGCRVNLLCSENIPGSVFDEFTLHPEIRRVDSRLNYETIYDSDFVITKFGTATLECALLGTPFCAVYKSGGLNYYIAKMMIKTEFVSLVNIILEKEVVKEFIQKDFTKENIIGEFLKVFNDDKYRNIMTAEFILLRNYFNNVLIEKSAPKLISELLT